MTSTVLLSSILVTGLVILLSLVENEALGVKPKKYQITDSNLQVIKGNMVEIEPGTKFHLSEDYQLSMIGNIKFERMDDLMIYYHFEKKSMNFVKDGEVDVCEAMRENQDHEQSQKGGECMFNMFGMGTSCPIEQNASDGPKSCDMSDAKDKMGMAVGNTSFEYELNTGDDAIATVLAGWVYIEEVK